MAEQGPDTPDRTTETTEGLEIVNADATAGTPHPDLAFSGYTGATGVDPAPATRRRGPDPLALIVGLATLAMAVFAFVGELPDLSGVDPRWLLAGGAAAVGLVLLVGSLRGRKN